VPLVLKKGERSVFLFTGGGLFEPRRGPGHYQGASQGFSIPIGGTRVRYRIGQSRGTFIQGDENPTIIDTGTVVVTTQRVVFLGTKRTVEWAFSKLIAVQHYQNRPWTAIQVSNRQKVTGITYDAAHEHNLRLRLEAAVAMFNQDTVELRSQLDAAIAAHDALRPPDTAPAGGSQSESSLVPELEMPGPDPAVTPMSSSHPPPTGSNRPTPLSALAPTPPGGWYVDPAGRHEHRFWDGARWTDAVDDRGVQGVDPP
jgi:hypothetical protein